MDHSQATPNQFGGGLRAIHFVVVGLSLLLTLSAWHFSKKQIESRISARFDQARDQALGLISDRMLKYEDALWSGVAAVYSHGGDMSYADWHTFARTLRIEEKYPGINGIGIIHYVPTGSFDAYLTQRRLERPGYSVFPQHDFPIFMPISFIEPENANAAAIGLDVAHEVNRRTAALASRDSGTSQITGPIVLVQDAGNTPGFLFYAPFYRGGTPFSVEERQARFAGAVYAPFVVRKLMEGLLSKDLRDIRFAIRDGDELIYDEHNEADPLRDKNPLMTDVVDLELYGRTWRIDLRSNLAFRANNSYSQPTIILVAGLIIEALIITLLVLMARANRNAVSYANRVNASLMAESDRLADTNRKLVAANQELEQFAYVASHDLKTPIRGIGGLTDIIEEDLEAYFSSPDANPDVQTNLTLIRDRVQRMNDLTRGILEYSRVRTGHDIAEPISLEEVVNTLRVDFDLSAQQLRLVGNARLVDRDTLNLRRVLENLVGNAVKHHNSPDQMHIEITAQDAGNHLEISVRDNGPGIDPRFHTRIFDIFQTLRTGNSDESTGIGLAIVKKAVENNGGTISLTSSVGQGATFSFPWPKAAADAAKPPSGLKAA